MSRPAEEIGKVVHTYRHQDCCMEFAGRDVMVLTGISENGAYFAETPVCARTHLPLVFVNVESTIKEWTEQ